MIAAAGIGLVVILVLVSLLSLRLREASIVDVFWGLGFVALNATYALLIPDGAPARRLAATLLVSLRGLRLAAQVFLRNWRQPEAHRHCHLREQAGKARWWRSYFTVFVLHGLLVWVIGLPLRAAQASPIPPGWTWIDTLVVGVWATEFLFESIGDAQLARFRSRPENKGKLLTHGLWRYRRHPDYFGEAVHWRGLSGLAVAVHPNWTVFSPLAMTWLPLSASGVAMVERTMASTGPGYEPHVATTSAFAPRPPGRAAGGSTPKQTEK